MKFKLKNYHEFIHLYKLKLKLRLNKINILEIIFMTSSPS